MKLLKIITAICLSLLGISCGHMTSGLPEVNNESIPHNDAVADSLQTAKGPDTVVSDFLQWYSNSRKYLAGIQMVNNAGGTYDSTKFYSVNFPATEKYLSAFKESGFVSLQYLDHWRDYFKEADDNFRTHPQNDGPPNYFEYDFVSHSQEEEDWNHINKARVESKEVQGDKAALTVHMPSGQNLVFTLSRHGQSWLIQRIENVTAEEDGLLFQETEPEEKFILSLNDTLYTGDTLTIRFKAPHPKDLAITGPGDTFYFLVYQAFGQDMPPLVEPEKFGDLNKLDIITDQTKANPWVAGNKENRLIFTKAGKYTIRLSENLETDDGTPVETKEVYYTAKPRRN